MKNYTIEIINGCISNINFNTLDGFTGPECGELVLMRSTGITLTCKNVSHEQIKEANNIFLEMEKIINV
jgi:hypothetical protein